MRVVLEHIGVDSAGDKRARMQNSMVGFSRIRSDLVGFSRIGGVDELMVDG